jgi:hypothetical protein
VPTSEFGGALVDLAESGRSGACSSAPAQSESWDRAVAGSDGPGLPVTEATVDAGKLPAGVFASDSNGDGNAESRGTGASPSIKLSVSSDNAVDPVDCVCSSGNGGPTSSEPRRAEPGADTIGPRTPEEDEFADGRADMEPEVGRPGGTPSVG